MTPRREESFPAVTGILQEFRREVTRNFGCLGTNADQADLTDANPISNHDDSETWLIKICSWLIRFDQILSRLVHVYEVPFRKD